jgi:CheY-like chemotaxis protein
MTDSDARADWGERPTVLVVDDEEAFAESAALWLEDEYDVRVATDGEAAIEKYGPDVDAVLLDRRMPGLSGDEVLDRLDDAPGDAGIAMMSAVEPDYDVVEMPFDSYLRKPVAKEDIQETTEKLVRRANYPRQLRELFALVATIEALGERYPRHELESDERHQELVDELESMAAAVTADISTLHEADRERFRKGFDETLRHR